ncbi:MAG: hypothetical protein RIK87_02470 [Fuerstiella sp.]
MKSAIVTTCLSWLAETGNAGEARLPNYDLDQDISEEHDVAISHPDVVKQIAAMMESAPTPSDRYPIGKVYRGKPLWNPGQP